MNLAASYRPIRAEIDKAIARVLDGTDFILGKEVAGFEAEFAAYSQVEHGIGTNSGTSALQLALLAAGVGPGDEVITVPFTFFATVAAIEYIGATAVFTDIDPGTFNMDVTQIESVITPRTRAILPVHLYGQPADLDPILEIARKHNLMVIEDAAQAHGSEYRGRRVGGIGHITCFSFYPTKNLGAAGEGGMITTNDASLARRVRMLRDWGQEQKYLPVLKGFNFRMEGLQASILRVKLRHLEQSTEARRELAARYDRALSDSSVVLPVTREHVRHVYHLYTIRTPKRAQIKERLAASGIQTAVHYPAPVHLLPAYRTPRYNSGDLPQAEAAANEVLSLPLFPELTGEEQNEVISGLQRAQEDCKCSR